MKKTLQKAVMTRSKLHNKILRDKTPSNESAYKSREITESTFFEKKIFFEKLDTKNITDNKMFWKTVKPFLANTSSNSRNRITYKKR